jgi:myo-inositol-1(or 4)-monophosphatase
VARAAGRIHLRRLGRVKFKPKTNPMDLVTETDRESEQAVIRTLKRASPDHAILAEESGASVRQGVHRSIINPIDGITNFAHGFPQFCVSIAFERRGRLELWVVFDALRRELFFAVRGRGARLNGRPIHLSATASLDRALLATFLPYDQRERRNFYLAFWEAFMMCTRGVRHAEGHAFIFRQGALAGPFVPGRSRQEAEDKVAKLIDYVKSIQRK